MKILVCAGITYKLTNIPVYHKVYGVKGLFEVVRRSKEILEEREER